MPASEISLLRLPEVESRTGLRRSSIYDRVRVGQFPAPVPLGGNRVAWRSDEVANWIESRIAARDAKAGAR